MNGLNTFGTISGFPEFIYVILFSKSTKYFYFVKKMTLTSFAISGVVHWVIAIVKQIFSSHLISNVKDFLT